MSGVAPRRVDGLEGTVVRAPLGAGSKSARLAFWLETPDGRLELRLKPGPAYGDTRLERWLGRRVACDGVVIDYLLLAERVVGRP